MSSVSSGYILIRKSPIKTVIIPNFWFNTNFSLKNITAKMTVIAGLNELIGAINEISPYDKP
jgi:hypothetical protein